MLESLCRVVDMDTLPKIYVLDNSNISEVEDTYLLKQDFIELVNSIPYAEYIETGNNLGFGRANNIALQKTDCVYHAFVNPDVIFIEDSLSILGDFLDDNPEIGMCIPLILDEDGKRQDAYRAEVTMLDALNRTLLRHKLRKRDRLHSYQDADFTRPFKVDFAQGCFLLGRTNLLKKELGFDERYFMYLEDADLCKRINQIAQVFFCPDTTIIHLWERSSHKNAKLAIEHLKSYYRYFKKWGFKIA